MVYRKRYDPQNVEPSVQVEKAALINAYVNGGVEGGTPAADYFFRKRMERLGYDPQDIEAAYRDARVIADDAWRKKQGL